MTQRLSDGVRTFRTTEFPKRQQQFAELATGQAPHTLFITCSDSRIDPSLITQSEPGEIFVIRNAGNLVPAHAEEPAGGEAATLEYAVVALGVRDIVVCGHSHCGAMAGLLAPASLQNLPGVASWLRHAEPTRERVQAAPHATEGRDAVRVNVAVQIEHLRSYAFVREAEAEGKLALHGWVYVFESGEILQLQADGTFSPLLDPTQLSGAA